MKAIAAIVTAIEARPMTIRELCEYCGYHRNTVASAIRYMRQNGLVTATKTSTGIGGPVASRYAIKN